jgi:hypothetical protein
MVRGWLYIQVIHIHDEEWYYKAKYFILKQEGSLSRHIFMKQHGNFCWAYCLQFAHMLYFILNSHILFHRCEIK